MTPEETVRRNTAIALFMGYERDVNIWAQRGVSLPAPDGRAFCFTHDLKYHEDWSWLMPVVEKIVQEREDGFHLLIAKKGYSCRFGMGQNIGWDKEYTLIEATWMAVSEWVLSRETPGKQQQKV